MTKGFTQEQFISKARDVHGDTYDYSETKYVNMRTKVTIICPTHGRFEQNPSNHVINKQRCYECAKDSERCTKESFINKARAAHGDVYDYTQVDYKNNSTKITIICPTHGEFEQIPKDHCKGHGCFACGNGGERYTTETFIRRAMDVHGNVYDYTTSVCSNAYSKVNIICPNHGEFEQLARQHLMGQGCPTCRSSKGELLVSSILSELDVEYEREKRLNDCRNIHSLPFDFYLPEYPAVIEFDGIQHFKPIEYWGGIDGLNRIQKNDAIKTAYCSNNNLPLLRISYRDERIDDIIYQWLGTLA